MDARPPRSIPSACLEAIQIVLKCSACRRTRIPSKTLEQTRTHREDIGQRDSAMFPLMLDEEQPIWDYGQPSEDWAIAGADFQNGENWPESGVEFNEHGFWESPNNSQSSTNTLTDSQNSNSSFSSQNSALDRSLSFDSFSARSEGFRYAKHEVKSENIFNLLNDSMSILFYDRRPRKLAGVVLASDTGFPRLPATSPALFSPGYLEVRPQISHGVPYHNERTLILIDIVSFTPQ